MEILEKVESSLPKGVVSRIELEGCEIIVYTKSKEFFLTHEELIKNIVSQLKKRIEVRAEKEICLEQDAAKKIILETVPQEAKIHNIYFEDERSLVIISAEKPGLVIGKGGETLREIKRKTFWVPRIERIPAIRSNIVEGVRNILHQEVKFRKAFLNKVGKNIFTERKTNRDWIRITGLGGWGEVGRSCILLETPKSKVLIDCGINVGGSNANMLPIFHAKEFDYNELDAIIISHTHLDHCGAVPILYEYGYDGPLYCTTPTIDLATLLWLDYIDVMQKSMAKPLFSVRGVKEAVKHTIALDYGEVSDVAPDVRLTFENAGHVLGCVTGDTLVMLSDGSIYEIKELCNPHSQKVSCKALDGNMKLIDSNAVVFRKDYSGNLYKVYTQSGNIVVTGEHPFFTLENGKIKEIRTDELTPGMYIAAPKKISVIGSDQKLMNFQKSKAHNSIHIISPEILTSDLAQLVGYILGDGNTAWSYRKNKKPKSGALYLHDKNKEMLIFYEELIKKIFKFSRIPKIRINQKKRNNKSYVLNVNCSELVRFLERNFIESLTNSPKRKIPKLITKCKNEEIASFLRGLFDAEGSPTNSGLELTTSSKNIAYGTMLLLLRLNILSSITEGKNYGFGKRRYRLAITDRESIDLFYKLINFSHPEKKRKLEELIKKPRHPSKQSSTNVVPSLGKILRELRKCLKINRDDCVVSIKHFEEGHSISYPSLQKLFDQFNAKLEKLKKYYNNEIDGWNEIGEVIKDAKITKTELAKLVKVNPQTVDNWIKGKNKPLFNCIDRVKSYVKQKLREIVENENVRRNLNLIETILKSDVRWVKIKRIKRIKNKRGKVYDFYVPKYHSFISNGLISHNSSLIHLHIGEGLHNILYALDQKFGRTALLEPAHTDFQRNETLIIESTYGKAEDIMPSRKEAEKQLMDVINKTMERKGIVLIPSFAVERAQEVMAILVENNFQYPVYIDGMIWDANGIFTAYPEYLSRNMRKKIFAGEDPFVNPMFKRIASSSEREKAWEDRPCVIISTSGMLVGGPAIEHLKALAEDEKNTLIFVGYQVEGSLGRRIQKGWKEIPFKTEEGKTITLPLKMEVQTIDGLSGHSGRNQLLAYIGRLTARPEKVVVIHGENQKAIDFAKAVQRIFRIEAIAPRNLETIRLK